MKQQRGALRVQVLTGAVFLAAALCARPSPGAAQQNAQASPAQAPPAQTSPAQVSPAQTTFTEQLLISGKQQWSDTGIDLYPGDVVKFVASGTLDLPGEAACGPDGRLRDWHNVTTRMPINQAGVGSLIGRIGVAGTSHAFGIGSKHQTKVQTAGRLNLGINEASNESASGTYHVTIEIVHAAPEPIAGTSTATAGVVEVPAAAFPSAGLTQIPLRVTNKAGVPGDMVNFVLIGSEATVDQTFKEAGWRKVYDTNKEHRRAALGGIFSGFSHKPFVEMPMSQLYLYGRAQDVGYAQGIPVQALGSRHHLRLWKAPMQVDGQDVWVGAGTHDESFMHDPHHKGFSHYIDPNVDDERTYIQQTLGKTHEATQWTMVQPANPIQNAMTVSGQVYHSNGKMLVLWLHSPAAPEISAQAGGSVDTDGAAPVAEPGTSAFTKN